ncbi:hypothetical protein J6590_051165 [Homalodisca vitripennis]|nr:hypothetical protein J6590_051165 [Homalodisca vitripennis]
MSGKRVVRKLPASICSGSPPAVNVSEVAGPLLVGSVILYLNHSCQPPLLLISPITKIGTFLRHRERDFIHHEVSNLATPRKGMNRILKPALYSKEDNGPPLRLLKTVFPLRTVQEPNRKLVGVQFGTEVPSHIG